MQRGKSEFLTQRGYPVHEWEGNYLRAWIIAAIQNPLRRPPDPAAPINFLTVSLKNQELLKLTQYHNSGEKISRWFIPKNAD